MRAARLLYSAGGPRLRVPWQGSRHGVRLGGGQRERLELGPARMEVPKGSREEVPKEDPMGALSGHPTRVRGEVLAGSLKASPEESLTGDPVASRAVSLKADPT